jgi:hypothetical protein
MIYKTNDLWLASYLECKGYKILNFSKANESNHYYFEFEDTDIIKHEVKSYFLGDALVDPKLFKQHVLDLKSNIYSMKQ